MDRDAFWSLIESAREESGGNLDELVELLYGSLSARAPEEIVAFQEHLDACIDRAYHWDLRGAAFLANRGGSDDMFLDFRAWLVAQGQAAYTAMMNDAQSLLEHVDDPFEEEYECQSLLHVAARAYETVTGQEMPASPRDEPTTPAGTEWSESGDDLERRFPRLWARFAGDGDGDEDLDEEPGAAGPPDRPARTKPWWKLW